MLTYHHRFHGHGSLRYLYQNGDAVRSHVMTVKYITNPRRKHSRFAVVISKKVLKSAVRRNRVRRRVYEVIRAELPMLKDNHDIALIIVTADLLHMEYKSIQNEVKRLFSQANLYK